MNGHHDHSHRHRHSHGRLPAAPRSGRAGRSLAADRLAGRRTALKRVAGGFAALAVVGATLSLAASPGVAVGGPADGKGKPKAPAFSGYASNGSASPLKIEIYEPTIPLPSVPQAEVSVGFSSVQADSASSKARASYLWPGASIGEGFKTITDMLGLPPQIGEQGYPVQVNAGFPSGPEAEADEPVPGMIQRAEAGDDTARADNGVSTDSRTKDDDETGGSDGPLPGLPGLPGLPALPGLPSLDDALPGVAALTGSDAGTTARTTAGTTAGTNAKAPAAAPALPDPLAALVDIGGFSSTARTDNGTDAFAQARSSANDISILGGLATIESVKTVANASSDGKKGTGKGVATYGDLVVAGQRFTFGSDGYQAAGTALPIPGLPAQGAALLEQLGITISVPQPVYEVDGDAASTTMQGLVIDFDLTTLKKKDGGLSNQLLTVLGMLPEQAAPLTGPLQAAVLASPRIVFYVGTSFAGVDTSQAIEPPPAPTEEPTEGATQQGGGGAAAGSGGAPSAPT
ncbi:choice-of-anchor P family protein, partial [Nocardioides sp.]|uniref:choice-of-anchor P family protein n=1 Tax=Nocardioides sp. TaxID=35761 RepID=UPI002718A805